MSRRFLRKPVFLHAPAALCGSRSPATIPNLALWLRADSGLFQDSAKTTPVTADAQSIGAWVDKVTGTVTFSQNTGSAKPTYKTAIINGHPVVRVDANDILTTAALSIGSGPKTCFAVMNAPSGSFLIDSQTGRFVLSATGSNTHYAWFDPSGGWKNSFLSPVSGFGVFSWWLGDPIQGQGEIFYNGASVGTGKFVNAALGGTTALFAVYTGTPAFVGDLAELLIYNAYLSETQRKAVESYLYQRYNLDAINPYAAANTAYVTATGNDGTGALGSPELPFATINAAFGVIPAWGGIIDIGAGTFAAINDDEPTIAATIKRNTRLQGAGRPNFNSGKTGLEGGTIIKGPLWIKQDGVQLKNLGIDSGSDVCTADYGGVGQEGIRYDLWTQGADQLQVKNIVLENVAAIAKAANYAGHAMGFEGTYYLLASGLRTCYAVHGIAIKSIGAILSDIVCNGHNQNGIVVKIETAKICNNVTISNVTINHVASGDTEGVRLHWYSGTLDLHTIVITDIYVTTTAPAFGIIFTPGAGEIRDVTVTNLTGKTTVVKDAGTITNCTVNGSPV